MHRVARLGQDLRRLGLLGPPGYLALGARALRGGLLDNSVGTGRVVVFGGALRLNNNGLELLARLRGVSLLDAVVVADNALVDLLLLGARLALGLLSRLRGPGALVLAEG